MKAIKSARTVLACIVLCPLAYFLTVLAVDALRAHL